MLRIHFVQEWFDLSHVALEDALMRAFAGIALAIDTVPEATTSVQCSSQPRLRVVAGREEHRV